MVSAPVCHALLLAVFVSPVLCDEAYNAGNPIRKVVTLLQNMQAKVTAEGNKEAELMKKFVCYCKQNGNNLDASITEANNKIESLGAALEVATAKKAQTEQDLKDHQASRAEAKEAMAQATALREKEAKDFAKVKADNEMNLAALTKAIAAISKGIMGGFLQTSAANTLRRFIIDKAELNDGARQELLAFLSGSDAQGYVPQSGEVVGILKQIKDDMAKNLADATADENAAIQSYEGLMAAKQKEVAALTAQIEQETTRIGDLGVQIASMANDLEDTKDTLSADAKFLAGLKEGCDTKAKEWAVVQSIRAEELVALAEVIKVLNDDDALELFKKTLPSASSSFVQVKVSGGLNAKDRALAALRSVKRGVRPEVDFIEMALKGSEMGFEKVIKMIDRLVVTLKNEQTDDDGKKEYCGTQLDANEDKKKSLELSIKDSETAIEEMNGSLATLKDEIAGLEASIKALDASVADATGLRKAEHDDYTTLMTDDSNAKEVLLWAKNRLNKFYSPKMYKAAPKRDLTDAEGITVSMGGSLAPTPAPGGIAGTGIGAALFQVVAHKHAREAPPPPPETFGAYAKKGGESAGVVSMIDLLVKDLDKEMQEAGVNEKESQREYEAMMGEAAAKRAEDSKAITDKAAFKGKTEEALSAETDAQAGATRELTGVVEVIGALHAECDWLTKYYDVRKAARASEIDALGNAKAVLSGADFALMQTRQVGFLSRH